MHTNSWVSLSPTHNVWGQVGVKTQMSGLMKLVVVGGSLEFLTEVFFGSGFASDWGPTAGNLRIEPVMLIMMVLD